MNISKVKLYNKHLYFIFRRHKKYKAQSQRLTHFGQFETVTLQGLLFESNVILFSSEKYDN